MFAKIPRRQIIAKTRSGLGTKRTARDASNPGVVRGGWVRVLARIARHGNYFWYPVFPAQFCAQN